MSTEQYNDMTDDPEYQAFVEKCAENCNCHESLRPCDGCLAGGMCDNITFDELNDEDQPIDPWNIEQP